MRPHILVADDEPAILYTLSFLFRKHHYRVTLCNDGEAALNHLLTAEEKSEPFDLLLTDIKMPKISGTELIQEVRKNKLSLPILVVSGVRDEDLVKKLLKLGCSDFLIKPYDLREIVNRVERLIKLNREDGNVKNQYIRTHSMASLV